MFQRNETQSEVLEKPSNLGFVYPLSWPGGIYGLFNANVSVHLQLGGKSRRAACHLCLQRMCYFVHPKQIV